MGKKEKIIQFGEGGFLRGFCDWMIELVNRKTDFDGGIVVVQPIREGMCDALEAQGCVYTHLCRGKEGVSECRVEAITRCVKPYEDFDAYMALAHGADFRFVISNTTEAGIAFCEQDRLTDRPASTFPGKLTQLLYERFCAGLGGLVFLPCELIDKNGEALRAAILRYARLWELGDGFVSYIQNENIFCNTLVDRINTGYPKGEAVAEQYHDAMLNTSETFHLWVIEGYGDLMREIPFDRCGLNVILTDELEKYRTRKVRILNGAHTSLVPYALLSGHETVGECMADETMREHIRACVYDEIIPTLDLAREELVAYADEVMERFENPYITHRLCAIALNSVSKLRVRVLPSILEYRRRFGTLPPTLVFAFSKLIELYRTAAPVDDAAAVSFMQSATLSEILQNTDLWGEDLSFLYEEMVKHVDP